MFYVAMKIIEKKGYDRKREWWKWLLLALFFSILAPIMALVRDLNPEKFGKCPHCRSIIELGATVCPHCGRYITTPLSLTPQQQASQQTTSTSPDISQQQTSPQQTPQRKPQIQIIQITPTQGLKEKKEINEFGHKTNIKKSQNKVS
jgi:uncharacterized Zn finger protein (UPF0148 family)